MCANDGGGRNIGFWWDPVPGDDVERQACRFVSRRFRISQPVSFRAGKVRLESGGPAQGGDSADDFMEAATTPEAMPYGVGVGAFVGTAGFEVDGEYYTATVGGFPAAARTAPAAQETTMTVRAVAGEELTLRDIADFDSEAVDIASLGRSTEWEIEISTHSIITGAALGRSKAELRRVMT